MRLFLLIAGIALPVVCVAALVFEWRTRRTFICRECAGTGEVDVPLRRDDGDVVHGLVMLHRDRTCPRCNGTEYEPVHWPSIVVEIAGAFVGIWFLTAWLVTS